MNKRFFKFSDGTVCDLSGVASVDPIVGDAAWLRYSLCYGDGHKIIVYEDRCYGGLGNKVRNYPREKMIERWKSALDNDYVAKDSWRAYEALYKNIHEISRKEDGTVRVKLNGAELTLISERPIDGELKKEFRVTLTKLKEFKCGIKDIINISRRDN